MEELNAANWRSVWAEHSCAKYLPQKACEVFCEVLYDAFIAMLHVDKDDATEGRIAEHLSLLCLLCIHAFVVVAHDLLNDGIACISSLQDDMTNGTFSSGSSCNLLH